MIPREQPAEEVNQAKLRAQELAAAFEACFGQPRTRTPAQVRVLEHLAACAGEEQNSYRFNDAKDGIALIAAGIHRDGAKSMLLIIERQLSIAAQAEKPRPKKTTIKR